MKSSKVVCVCMVWVCIAVVLSTSVKANLVGNPGFEDTDSTTGEYPSTYGNWEGDRSAMVTSQNGIVPLEGFHMLHFIDSTAQEGASASASQVRQLIDITDYADLVAAGNATAKFSAYFNRVLGNSQTDTRFYVRVDAFSGQITDYVNLTRNQAQLATSIGDVYTDGDIGTWEMAAAELVIPSNTDFLAIQVVASENIYDDYVSPEFDGHYCDSVSLEIVPEPATLALLGVGMLLMRRKK